MKIKKLNEWKCGISIDDVDTYVEPTGALRGMIEHFGLIYNPSTERYDCDGDVNLYRYRNELSNGEREEFDKEFVRNGKMTIRFGEVKDDFILPGDDNKSYILTSLEGCPEIVGCDFNCSNNKLISLEGCPEIVRGCFKCSDNQLTSLEGCPEIVGCDFNCSNNKLISLEGCPETVGGKFDCSCNQLTTLECCPEIVGRHFDCSCNDLTSLEGCPKSVGCNFYCYNNQLTSLEGCPKIVDGWFDCSNNKTKFTENDVKAVCDVKNEIYV